jgi:hypothetical protein
MGVLTCSRRHCGNIMCDRSSNQYGYICNDCFDELVASGQHTNIEIFMDTPKTNDPTNKELAYERYNNEFPDQGHRWGT